MLLFSVCVCVWCVQELRDVCYITAIMHGSPLRKSLSHPPAPPPPPRTKIINITYICFKKTPLSYILYPIFPTRVAYSSYDNTNKKNGIAFVVLTTLSLFSMCVPVAYHMAYSCGILMCPIIMAYSCGILL